MYDPLVVYTIDQFRAITPTDLMILYKEALEASHTIQGIKQIQKVMRDIWSMRPLLAGYDGVYNRKHNR